MDVWKRDCPQCGGSGDIPTGPHGFDRCDHCNGVGEVTVEVDTSGMSEFHKHEPNPVIRDRPFEESVQGQLYFACMMNGHVKTAAAIKARAEEGKKKYGTYLFNHDGRNTYMDAAQEALDLAVYLTKLDNESGNRFHDETITKALRVLLNLVERGVGNE